jgi:hypothetical protein
MLYQREPFRLKRYRTGLVRDVGRLAEVPEFESEEGREGEGRFSA